MTPDQTPENPGGPLTDEERQEIEEGNKNRATLTRLRERRGVPTEPGDKRREQARLDVARLLEAHDALARENAALRGERDDAEKEEADLEAGFRKFDEQAAALLRQVGIEPGPELGIALYEAIKTCLAVASKRDAAVARAEEAERERDKLIRLHLVKCNDSWGVGMLSYAFLKRFNTEAEAVAFIRKAAGIGEGVEGG